MKKTKRGVVIAILILGVAVLPFGSFDVMASLNDLKFVEGKTFAKKDNHSTSSYKITFYDLSYQSCGKYPWEKNYGITATGYSLKGKGVSCRTISVDPRVIPLGSKVKITFKNKKYSFLNATYTARDTGGAIKGRKFDLYLGENKVKLCYKYGVQYATIKVVRRGW